MPRLRNARTGSVVNVDDATAGQLGQEWEPADTGSGDAAPAKKAPQRRKASTGDE